SVITAVLVRIDDRAGGGHGFRQNALTGGLVAVADYPAPLFSTLSADDMNDWRPVVVIGAVTHLFIGAAARWVERVAMRRTFFPRRSGRFHPPRTSGHPSGRLARCR